MKHAYDMYFKLKLNFVFILLTFNTTYLYKNEVSSKRILTEQINSFYEWNNWITCKSLYKLEKMKKFIKLLLKNTCENKCCEEIIHLIIFVILQKKKILFIFFSNNSKLKFKVRRIRQEISKIIWYFFFSDIFFWNKKNEFHYFG